MLVSIRKIRSSWLEKTVEPETKINRFASNLPGAHTLFTSSADILALAKIRNSSLWKFTHSWSVSFRCSVAHTLNFAPSPSLHPSAQLLLSTSDKSFAFSFAGAVARRVTAERPSRMRRSSLQKSPAAKSQVTPNWPCWMLKHKGKQVLDLKFNPQPINIYSFIAATKLTAKHDLDKLENIKARNDDKKTKAKC